MQPSGKKKNDRNKGCTKNKYWYSFILFSIFKSLKNEATMSIFSKAHVPCAVSFLDLLPEGASVLQRRLALMNYWIQAVFTGFRLCTKALSQFLVVD